MILTPTVLFISGCTATTLVIALTAFALHYYIKAKEIAPYLLQLEELQRRIAEAQTTLEETKRDIKVKMTNLHKPKDLSQTGTPPRNGLKGRHRKSKLAGAVERLNNETSDAGRLSKRRELNELTQQVADKNTEPKSLREERRLGH